MADKATPDVVKEFQSRKRFAIDHKNAHDEVAEMYFNYYACEQWSEEDVAALKAQGRPALTFNQTGPVINAISGSEITNRFETKFLPRTADDQGFTDIVSDVVRYLRQESNAEHEDSTAFRDCAISGVGVTELKQDYSEDVTGQTLTEAVSPFETFWDPYASQLNLTNRRYDFRGTWIPVEEAFHRWPDAQEAIEAAIGDGDVAVERLRGKIHDNSRDMLYRQGHDKWYDHDRDEVLVWDYQRFELEPWVVFEDADGRKEVSRDEFKKLTSRLEENGMQAPFSATFRKKRFMRAYLIGDILLDDFPPEAQCWTRQFITGFPHRERGGMRWFGLMKPMVDAQKWTNKAASQLIYIVSTNPKGAILGPRTAFADPDTVKDRWAEPNAFIETQENIDLDKDIRIIQGQYPASQERMMQLMTEAVPRVVGFNPFLVSNVEDLSRVATSAIRTVQNQGMVVLSTLFDALKKYRKEIGRGYLEYIKAFWPDGKIIRITQPSGVQVPMEFKKEWVERVRYDVVVDQAPTSPTAMMELWDSLQQTGGMEILMQTGLLTPKIIAQIIPHVPASIRAEMLNNVQKQDVVQQVMQLVSQGQNDQAIALIQQLIQEAA